MKDKSIDDMARLAVEAAIESGLVCEPYNLTKPRLIQVIRAVALRECADFVLKLHAQNCPDVGAIDALKTAYDEFNRRARQAEGIQ